MLRGANSQEARDTFYPYYASYFRNHAPKTNYHPEVAREEFEARAAPDGAIFVGSPQEIIDKIMHERELFGHQRFLAQVDIGGLPYAKVAEFDRVARDEGAADRALTSDGSATTSALVRKGDSGELGQVAQKTDLQWPISVDRY